MIEQSNTSLATVMLVMVRNCGLSKSPTNDIQGNLHLNVVADSYMPEIQAALEPYIYQVVGEWWNYFLVSFLLSLPL
jgi:hypothetical protein